MKKKMVRSGKSFRLIDFNVFDEKPVISSCSSEDDKPSGYCEDDDDYYRQQLSRKKKQQSSSKIPKFVIQMYGINEKGETCSISVDDYQPFFYILVLDSWTQENCDKFYKELCHKIGKQGETSIVSVKLVEYNKLYGFTAGKQSKFMHIVFQNTFTMMRVRGLWYEWIENGDEKIRKLKPMYSQGCKLELYESKLPPLLRYFHIHNISPSGWVFIPVNEVIIPENKTTTCKFEYICSYKQIITQNQKETRVPYKICSFDIEASSSHGDFPIPIKTYKRLATQLVDVYKIHSISIHERDVEIIRRIVLAAFGYGTFSDIDLVYPKGKKPSKKMLEETLIPKLLAYSFAKDDALSIQNTAMTIETMFEKMKEQNLTTNEQDDGGDMDEEPEEVVVDYHSDEDESSYACSARDDRKDVGSDVGAETSDSVTERKPPVANVSTRHVSTLPKSSASEACFGLSSSVRSAPCPKKDKESVTIFDILKTEQYTRDEKIQWINQAFCDEDRVGFPQLEGDKVTFIGSTFMRYGEPEPYLNHCVVLNTCDQIPGCVIDTTETEEDLLLAWTSLIQKENPDIIIGYNIFGFDYEFMFRRAQENHCAQEFLQLSRKLSEDATNANANTNLTLDNTKIVLATGEYDLRYPFMSGRLQIDMYTYFRRDFNLASYKLDDVAGQYICDDVKKVEFVTDTESGKKQTNLYTNNITGLHVGDYIHIEISGFTSDYYRDGHKFVVKEIQPSTDSVSKYILSIEGHETELNNQTKSIKWCIAKDDVSVQDIFRLTNGDSADRARVAKYCIQDCNLVHHLMNKIDVITGYVEMSKICSVPISFLIFRGQGIKLTSYVSKKCREKKTLMPDLEKSYDADGYEGAIVLPPKCAMYMDNPVACLDYASLYPSSMISNNLSPDSKVWTKEYDLQGNPAFDSRGNIKETGEKNPKTGQYKYDNLEHLGYKYIDIEFDTFEWRRNGKSKAEKTKVGKKICRWVQLPDHQKSIMPAILEELLKARSDTRKLIKTTSDPFMQNILDKRQLGYKVTANSLYGQCGAKTSTFFEKDVAASTTATGRMMITYAKRIIEEVYGDLEYSTKEHGDVKCCAEYVYGDTDSVFFTFNLKDPKNGENIRGKKALEVTIEIAQDAAQLCTQFLKPPMELSYEKTLMPFILLSKKRYVGMLYETNPNKGKMKYMGLSLKRRDSCDYLKDVYGGILTILMNGNEGNIQRAVEFLDNSLKELIQGNVSMEKLEITKALRGYYKNPKQIAHAVLAERIAKRDPGNKPKPGDRMKFVHIVNKNGKALQGDKIETPEYILQNKLHIDYSFYITNQLMKPLQQLFGLALEQICEYKNKHSAKLTIRKDIKEIERECEGSIELFMKKREKYCSAQVKKYVFEKYLIDIQNQKNGMQSIMSCFAKK